MKLTLTLLAAGLCLAPQTFAGQDGLGSESGAATPRRVIATAPSNVEIVCALGAGERLVGVSPYVTYPPTVHDLPKVGGIQDPDLEAILALRPDLVILRGRNVHLERLCAENGIRLYDDQTDSLPSLFVTIRELGDLLDLPQEARKVGDALRARLEAVRTAAAARPRLRVLLTLRSPDKLGSMTTVGKGSYLNAVVELAGGKNVFGDLEVAYPQISLEEIVVRQPEVIIEAMPGEVIDDARRRQLLAQWKAVGTLQAAQSGRIHYLTENYVLIPSPRAAQLAEKLEALFASETRPSGE